ncbi:MAG: phosphoribosylglycinamide formyltransferase 1 [Acidobacteriota bacterium]|jgi:phosphoribosylglycinamide formyltransferase-1|nr:phosphoribosylglycinamide formyltransferase 1 [Acidobacteriota bacterium]
MRIGILISGRGSNMTALADAVGAGRVPGALVAIVLSDKPEAAGLARARGRGIETAFVERRGRTREEHEREVIARLREHGVELVCLAGYMRLLSPCFIEEFRGRVLNVHPSLLPAFPGLDAQRQAIAHGVKYSGCTVHFVDETLDGGPIIAQRVVPVLDDDTPDTLAARILVEEHKTYPEALALVCGGYEIKGRRVIVPRSSHPVHPCL